MQHLGRRPHHTSPTCCSPPSLPLPQRDSRSQCPNSQHHAQRAHPILSLIHPIFWERVLAKPFAKGPQIDHLHTTVHPSYCRRGVQSEVLSPTLGSADLPRGYYPVSSHLIMERADSHVGTFALVLGYFLVLQARWNSPNCNVVVQWMGSL